LPETRLDPDDVYRAMRRGVRVSTAQASTHERHLCYQRLAAQWKHVLYLCVGSVYTGNCDVARAWCAERDRGGPMTVLDSGAASGRLAVVVRAAVLKARVGLDAASLAAFAESALGRAEEYIFVERLEYLARGGRLSKTGAWFGDALGLAPVVSPFADGARKVALLRKPEAKLDFACQRVKRGLAGSSSGYVLIEHTDNRRWVEREVLPRLKEVAPKATIEIGPLSLTTGVHTGPGTWAVAFLPDAAISLARNASVCISEHEGVLISFLSDCFRNHLGLAAPPTQGTRAGSELTSSKSAPTRRHGDGDAILIVREDHSRDALWELIMHALYWPSAWHPRPRHSRNVRGL
jgi:DegV family protein with EDD domain